MGMGSRCIVDRYYHSVCSVRMKLYAHQQALVDLFPKRHLIAWAVRTGKTLTSIALANKAGFATLVIVPKKLKHQWEKTMHMEATVAYKVLTKEEFSRDARELPYFDTIIVDEAHHFSGMKSQMSKQLERYIRKHNPGQVYLLTGTPYRSSPWNIYRLATILGHKIEFRAFRDRFFTERYIGRGVVYVPRVDCQEELADIVRTIGSIVRLEDCTDMPKELEPIIEEIPMTTEQRKEIADIKINETNPLARFNKYHQVASGILIGNEFVAPKQMACNKDQRILELIEEHGRVLIFARFNLQLERYAKLLKENNIPCVILNGATVDVEAGRQAVRELKRGAGLIQISGAEGYDFSGYSVSIYASLSYSLLDFEQSQGRTKHMEKTVPNLYIVLNTVGSADEPVWASIGAKRSFSEAIFAREHLNAFERGV